jgi:hypothetical protein
MSINQASGTPTPGQNPLGSFQDIMNLFHAAETSPGSAFKDLSKDDFKDAEKLAEQLKAPKPRSAPEKKSSDTTEIQDAMLDVLKKLALLQSQQDVKKLWLIAQGKGSGGKESALPNIDLLSPDLLKYVEFIFKVGVTMGAAALKKTLPEPARLTSYLSKEEMASGKISIEDFSSMLTSLGESQSICLGSFTEAGQDQAKQAWSEFLQELGKFKD